MTFTQTILYPPGAFIDASGKIAEGDLVKAFIDIR
jgi:hypothetical protein